MMPRDAIRRNAGMGYQQGSPSGVQRTCRLHPVTDPILEKSTRSGGRRLSKTDTFRGLEVNRPACPDAGPYGASKSAGRAAPKIHANYYAVALTNAAGIETRQ